jgi:hypothetical protein
VIGWTAAPLLGLILYWPGFTSWFVKDDFAWLGLYRMLQTGTSLADILFHPYAQGTVRTVSERIPYTSFVALFGMSSWPFHCLQILTFIAVTVMLTRLCNDLCGSRGSGWIAALLWTANYAVSVSLYWSAVYYELLCSLLFVTALWLLVRYTQTNNRRYLLAQWIVFLLGFGVLELNVVYPALAAVYALCCARHLLAKVLPLFVPSLLYSVAHLISTPLATEGPYRMHWDAGVFSTLWLYFKIALGPVRLSNIGILASKPRSLATLILTVAILGFLVSQIARRRPVSAFFASWFLIVLAPLVPLRDHITDYYLTIPFIGLAMLSAEGLSTAWKSGHAGRLAAIALAAVYLIPNLMIGRATAASFRNEGERNRRILEPVTRDARARGASRIVISGVTSDLQNALIVHLPFRPYGFDDVSVVSSAEEGSAAMRADPRTFAADLRDR